MTLQGIAKAQEDPKVFIYIFDKQRKKFSQDKNKWT